MIEDRRPLTRTRGFELAVPRRSIVGRTACTENSDPCWLVLAQDSLIGRVDADLMRLLDDSGYKLPTQPVPAAALVWLDVLIEELWVSDEVVDGDEVSTVVLILTLVDPRTETARWTRAFDAEEVASRPREARSGEHALVAAYCRVLEQVAEAIRAAEFGAAVAARGKP